MVLRTVVTVAIGGHWLHAIPLNLALETTCNGWKANRYEFDVTQRMIRYVTQCN